MYIDKFGDEVRLFDSKLKSLQTSKLRYVLHLCFVTFRYSASGQVWYMYLIVSNFSLYLFFYFWHKILV